MRHIKTYKLFEKKQTGLIYHFTDPTNLVDILKDDRMVSAHGDISFTRNFDLKDLSMAPWGICRIAFNGSNLTDKFHVEPYLFDPEKDPIFGGGQNPASFEERKKRYGHEREERIIGSEIKGIKKYIVQIDILKIDEHDPLLMRRNIQKNREAIDTIKRDFGDIRLNFVDKFTPVRGQIT